MAQDLGVAPNFVTFYTVVTTLGAHDQWHWARTVYEEMEESGRAPHGR